MTTKEEYGLQLDYYGMHLIVQIYNKVIVERMHATLYNFKFE